MPLSARRLTLAGLAVMLFAAALGLCVYCAARMPPAFYAEAIRPPASAAADPRRSFERVALSLRNQVQHPGRWETRLTQDELNDWLANELPVKFPRLMPPGISDPRVAIEQGRVSIGVRYGRDGIQTVLSISGEAYLTAQRNEIAIRLDGARAGLVPVPLDRFLSEMEQRAARAGMPLRWTETNGAPVALVRLPLSNFSAEKKTVVIERLECEPGQLVVGGRTVAPGDSDAAGEAATAAAESGKNEMRQR